MHWTDANLEIEALGSKTREGEKEKESHFTTKKGPTGGVACTYVGMVWYVSQAGMYQHARARKGSLLAQLGTVPTAVGTWPKPSNFSRYNTYPARQAR